MTKRMDTRRLLSSDLDTMATPALLLISPFRSVIQSDCHSVNYCFNGGFYGDASMSPDCDMQKPSFVRVLFSDCCLTRLIEESGHKLSPELQLQQVTSLSGGSRPAAGTTLIHDPLKRCFLTFGCIDVIAIRNNFNRPSQHKSEK